MNLKVMQCPACGANLLPEDADIEEGGNIYCVCQYCGTKVLVEEGMEIGNKPGKRTTEIHKSDPRANQKQNRTQRLLVKLGLAMASCILIGTGIAAEWLWAAGLGLMCTAILVGYSQWCGFQNGKIMVPWSVLNAQNMNYTEAEIVFRQSGFTNVISVPMQDVPRSFFRKTEEKLGMVETIRIGGREILLGGRMCDPDSCVVISYHSLAEEIPGRLDIQALLHK